MFPEILIKEIKKKPWKKHRYVMQQYRTSQWSDMRSLGYFSLRLLLLLSNI